MATKIENLMTQMDALTKTVDDFVHKPAGGYVNLPNGGSIPSMQTYAQDAVNTALDVNTYVPRSEFGDLYTQEELKFYAVYVDQLNGNDLNDGLTVATAKKNINNVISEFGNKGIGYLKIYVIGDYTFDGAAHINVYNMYLYIARHDPVQNATLTYNPGAYTITDTTEYYGYTCFRGFNSVIFLNWSGDVIFNDYILQDSNKTKIIGGSFRSPFLNVGGNSEYIFGINANNGYDVTFTGTVNDAFYLYTDENWAVSKSGFSSYKTFLSAVNNNITVKINSVSKNFNLNTVYGSVLNYSHGRFASNGTISFVDHSNVAVSDFFTDFTYTGGIVKDANGVPRNLNSNIIF